MTFASYFTCIMCCISVRVKGQRNWWPQTKMKVIQAKTCFYLENCTNESNTIASGTCICCINMHLLFRLSDVVISSRMYLQSHHVILIMSTATFVSFADSKPKTLPREHIDRYKRGDTHPVSALYQLSQVLQFQLDMKETVTTSK